MVCISTDHASTVILRKWWEQMVAVVLVLVLVLVVLASGLCWCELDLNATENTSSEINEVHGTLLRSIGAP